MMTTTITIEEATAAAQEAHWSLESSAEGDDTLNQTWGHPAVERAFVLQYEGNPDAGQPWQLTSPMYNGDYHSVAKADDITAALSATVERQQTATPDSPGTETVPELHTAVPTLEELHQPAPRPETVRQVAAGMTLDQPDPGRMTTPGETDAPILPDAKGQAPQSLSIPTAEFAAAIDSRESPSATGRVFDLDAHDASEHLGIDAARGDPFTVPQTDWGPVTGNPGDPHAGLSPPQPDLGPER